MDKKYFLVGNAHLDPVWQWRVPEGLALVKSTFQAALDRMEEYPDYIFTSACAGYYKWLKTAEPHMFEKIKKKIKEGRWQYTGAMWVQPDCNIPCGESFARHLLYSQKFFAENFGAKAETGYNVDSFGHNGMLPQLFSKAGIKNYLYMRPNDENEKPDLPKSSNLHWWESPDGSRVLAFRLKDSYGSDMSDKHIKAHDGYNHSQIIAYGVGNHGGGPSIEVLNRIENLRREQGKDKFIYSGVDKYFEYIRENENEDIPTVSEDLQHHASGCYSANSKIKKLNRRAENELIYAEKIDVMSSVLTEAKTHTADIEAAWEKVMFNQFHDILAGCSIKPAYDDAYAALGSARQTALEIGTFSAERITWRINTTKYMNNNPSQKRDRLWVKEGEGSPMVVFNPHSFPVHGYAYFGIQWVSGVVDENDNDVPFQLVRAPYTDGAHVNKCMFEVDIPAYGYATYFIFKEDQNYQPKERENQFKVTERSLENSVVRVEFDDNGAVCSYVDKRSGKEYCSSPMKTVICEDSENDTWAHNVFDFNKDIGEFSGARFSIREQGTLRATLRVTTYCEEGKLIQYFTLYKDSPKLEVRCKLSFRQEYKVVKMTFPTTLENPKAVYSMPFGYIEKEANGLEEPSQSWMCVTDGNDALALINDSKYSFCVKGSEMRMIAARTCAYLDHYGQNHRDDDMSFLDTDELEYTYALMPAKAGAYSQIIKEADLLNMPLQLYHETHHKGTLPPVYQGMSVDCDNVIVQSIKLAENGEGYILRAYECEGKAVLAEIDFKLCARKFAFDFKPHEIKTILIPFNGAVKGVPLTEAY